MVSFNEILFDFSFFHHSFTWHFRHKEAHDRGKRLFGREHPDFILMKIRFCFINAQHGPRHGTLATTKMNGKKVDILRATKDGKKYIVDIGNGQVVKVSLSQLILESDTPVLVNYNNEVFTVFIESYNKKRDVYQCFMSNLDEDNVDYVYADFNKSDIKQVQFGKK